MIIVHYPKACLDVMFDDVWVNSSNFDLNCITLADIVFVKDYFFGEQIAISASFKDRGNKGKKRIF